MKNSLLLLFILYFSLIFMGCVSNKPDIKSPKPMEDIPTKWLSWDKNISQNQKPIYWVETFTNPELNQAIRVAWSSNPDLVAQAEQTLARGEEAVIIGANLSPQANLGVSGTRSKRNLIGFNLPNGDTSFTSDSFNSGINLSWELDLWGKLKNQKKSAERRFNVATSDYEGARLSIAGKVAKAWFEIIESSQQSQLALKTMNTFEKNQAFISNRFKNGLATALENDLAINAYESARATFSMRDRQRSKSTRKFELLLGGFPDEKMEHNSSSLPELSGTPPPPTPAKILEQRPDLISSRLRLEAAGYQLSASQLSLLPAISITGGPGSRAENFKDLLDNKFRTWDIGGSLTQPIFQGGRLKAQIRRDEALKRAALANYKAMALRAFNEVENLLFNDTRLEAEESYLKNATQAAQSASQTSWDRYQGGVQEIFETLDIHRRSFEAESRLLSIRKERILNRINLYLALGHDALPTEP